MKLRLVTTCRATLENSKIYTFHLWGWFKKQRHAGVEMLKATMAPKTNKHLTPLEAGQIKAHLYHEVRPAEMQRRVKRDDGANFPQSANTRP